MRKTSGKGFKFVKVDIETARLILFTDASVAHARNLKSQFVYVVALGEQDG